MFLMTHIDIRMFLLTHIDIHSDEVMYAPYAAAAPFSATVHPHHPCVCVCFCICVCVNV